MTKTTINLTTSNRAVGLLNEVAELIAAETDAIELTRIQASLFSLMAEARTKSQQHEAATGLISKAARKQTISRKPFSARISGLMARC